MTRSIRPLYLALSLVACFGLSGCDSPDPSAEADEERASVDFVSDVKPILQTHCISCHNDESLFGDLNLMSRASAMRGSKRGPAIVPGHPDKSLLYQATDPDHAKSSDKAMPATGPGLDEAQKEILGRWIEQGAEWPEGEEGRIVPIKPDVDTV
ncbi:MAG: c-type cytochrome domain-containing protein [Verrucomicrobiales bacterium]